jgi:tetratricopeptide (TPR) repeat protein
MAEPFWTTLALIALGVLEMSQGRYDDALRLLTEMRDLAERCANVRLTAAARITLGRLALLRGRYDEAAELLGEGMELSRETRMTRNLSLSLFGFALLAFAGGDAERAALLAGAAEGVRQRAGLRVWPWPPQEGDRLAEIRRALGADRFDELFAEGTQLSQREAVAAVARVRVEPVP